MKQNIYWWYIAPPCNIYSNYNLKWCNKNSSCKKKVKCSQITHQKHIKIVSNVIQVIWVTFETNLMIFFLPFGRQWSCSVDLVILRGNYHHRSLCCARTATTMLGNLWLQDSTRYFPLKLRDMGQKMLSCKMTRHHASWCFLSIPFVNFCGMLGVQ